MSKVKFELNINGLREIMKSSEMRSVLTQHATKVRASAGEGFGTSTRVATYTGIATVYPDSKEGAQKNYEENTLLNALQTTGLPMKKG